MPIITDSGSYLPINTNQYVNRMQYFSGLRMNSETLISLGTPPDEDADGILDGVTATTTAQTYTSADFASGFTGTISAKYGAVLQLVGSSGANHVVSVYGRDCYGQPMVEAITANGTTIVRGKKAFKYIDKVLVAAGASGDTIDLGWTTELGLPFRAMELRYAFEDDVRTEVGSRVVEAPASALVDVSGTNTATVYAPFDGYCVGVRGTITTAVTTDFAVMDATVNGTGTAALDTVVPIGAIGLTHGKDLIPSAYVAVEEGDAIAWTSDGDPAAGAASFVGLFAQRFGRFNAADNTDPATATTGDTRGTYTPYMTLDGAKEVIVCITGDNRANSNNNGGLHGIPHYYA